MRLFLVFWGTILILVGGTVFISHKLNELDKVEPLNKYDLKKFEFVEHQLNLPKKGDLSRRIRFLHKKYPHWVFLYEADSQTIITDRIPPALIDKYLLDLVNPPKRAAERKIPRHLVYGPKLITVAGQQYQTLIVRKASPGNELIRNLYFSPLWSKILFAFLVTLLPCWLVARNLSIPISRLNQSTQLLAAGQLSHRVGASVINRPDEIGQLAVSFNQMAEKIENNLKLHKGLLANVSHELRTPLTRIELSLAMALKDPHKNSAKLHRIEQELHKLDALIANVLKLSRLENDDLPLERNRINLSQLVADICQSAKLECEEKDIQLDCHITQSIYYAGDELLLVRAFENILRNAIKFTPAGKAVKVELTQTDEHLVFAVQDQGPGVNESDIEKIFQPFYRAENNQYSSRGTGLGLTISHKAITRHNGHIYAKNIPDSGLRMQVLLPRENHLNKSAN